MKNLTKLKGTKVLSKTEQKDVFGGGGYGQHWVLNCKGVPNETPCPNGCCVKGQCERRPTGSAYCGRGSRT